MHARSADQPLHFSQANAHAVIAALLRLEQVIVNIPDWRADVVDRIEAIARRVEAHDEAIQERLEDLVERLGVLARRLGEPRRESKPTNPEPPASELPQADQDILRVLAEAGHRLTRAAIADALHDAHDNPLHPETTIRRALERLRASGLIDHDRQANPHGFGITPLGRRRLIDAVSD